MTSRQTLALGAILGALGVALGAFGAHALRGSLSPADAATFETAVRYQLVHAGALVALAGWAERAPSRQLDWASRLWSLGTVIFSGSLYLLVLLDQRWLGAVTPFGGVALIAGWLLVVASTLSSAAAR